jgi:hypothetical protein
MFWVTEHGENIGTIKKCFLHYNEAIEFIKQIIKQSGYAYRRTSKTKWTCCEKKEIIEIN